MSGLDESTGRDPFAGLGRLTTRLARLVALVGLIGLIVLSLMTIADVLMRWLFNSPIYGVIDLSAVAMAVIVAACMPAALAEKNHIVIRLIGGLAGRRANAVLEAFGQIVMFVIFAIMVWQFWIFVAQTKDAGTTTYILAIPLWPWWALATVLLTLCLPVHAVVVLREIVAAIRGTDSVPESEQAL